jgi:small conductance mechanosensitive channel
MKEQLLTAWQNMIDKLWSWMDAAITHLPNFLLALTIFGLSFWLARNLKKWLKKPLQKLVPQVAIRNQLATFLSILLVLVGLFLALGVMNLDKVVTSLLAGAGVAGLAIGLALQGTLANTFSGIYLAVKDVIHVGDFIESNGYSGTVHEISLRNTRILEPDNNLVVIPNTMILENPFKNFGLTQRIRTIVDCGIGYESDLEKVKTIVIGAINERFPHENKEDIQFFYRAFGDSSIDFQVRFWVEAKERLTILEAKSEAIILIKKTFDEHGINIPFPIRTLQVPQGLQVHANDREASFSTTSNNN